MKADLSCMLKVACYDANHQAVTSCAGGSNHKRSSPAMTDIQHNQIISRKQAMQTGLIHYFTGQPCKRNHISIRSIRGECMACYEEHKKTDAYKEKNKYSVRKEYFRKQKAEYYAIPENALKMRVRYRTRYAIKQGKLKRQPCEVCGELKVDAHHDDYSKPMDVRWLCRKHHLEHHENNQ